MEGREGGAVLLGEHVRCLSQGGRGHGNGGMGVPGDGQATELEEEEFKPPVVGEVLSGREKVWNV